MRFLALRWMLWVEAEVPVPQDGWGVSAFGFSESRERDGGRWCYFHTDLVGSVMLRTDGNGAALPVVASPPGGPSLSRVMSYTAFGEPVYQTLGSGNTVVWQVGGPLPAGLPRYGSCGGYGYESGLITLDGLPGAGLPPITLLHLGARWYDPAIGRFVQRDPIGLGGEGMGTRRNGEGMGGRNGDILVFCRRAVRTVDPGNVRSNPRQSVGMAPGVPPPCVTALAAITNALTRLSNRIAARAKAGRDGFFTSTQTPCRSTADPA